MSPYPRALWALCALLLAAPAARAEDPAEWTKDSPRSGGSDPADWTKDGASSPDAPVDLKANPGLVTPHDQSLLQEAGYRIQDGKINLPPGSPLGAVELQGVLERLRAARRGAALAELAALQRAVFGAGREGLGDAEAARLHAVLGRDWPLVPQDARDAMNDWLARSGYARVRGPDLDRVRRVADAWRRGETPGQDPFGDVPPPLRAPPEAGLTPRLGAPRWQAATSFLAPPAAEEVRRRLARVEAATWRDPKTGRLEPYPRNIKDMLAEIVRYASARDSEAALRTIEQLHPPITLSNKDSLPFTDGFARWHDPWTPPDKREVKIVLPEYTVWTTPPGGTDKDRKIKLPHPHPGYYAELGLPVPKVLALDPNARPDSTRRTSAGLWEYFSDGSARIRYNDAEARAALALHEILHLDTFAQGEGDHMFSNELKSFFAMNRFRFNRDLARGETDKPGYGREDLWLSQPFEYRESILKAYMSPEVGEVRPDEVTVADQLRVVEADLAKTGAAFDAARISAIEKRIRRAAESMAAVVDYQEKNGFIDAQQAQSARDRIRRDAAEMRTKALAENLDYRALLLWQKARLLKDQELELRVWQDDYRWHSERGIGYARKPK